ncbi:glycosyltransferase family 4 protein [uncultured Dokdonia sp.]|uniref:glycosyltransferase family 4 protein n=1 Tax=uncultured Dokdonia sp. TaxID=575653 RepID=UPI0026161673|nr:glycosyltransferase family 4 protein [uncultured Dokdonia sp.]
MKKTKSILIIGPFPEPTTGVSLANKVVRDILNEQSNYNVASINTSYSRFDEAIGKFSFHKLFFNLSFYSKAYKILSYKTIYITPGQTFFGVIKYTGFIIISSLLGREIIVHVHGNHMGNEYKTLHGVKKKLFHYLLSKTTKGIVLSKSLKGNMTPFIAEEKVKVLPNFAEDYLLNTTIKKSFEKLQIIYLSNLMEEKGIFDLLDALTLLEESKIPYEAKIAGAIDYTQKEEIEKRFYTLQHTTYVGIVKGNEKNDLLNWGTVFVLPTYYKMEGQPISILEAMATGNVILTTTHAGIPDVVTGGIHGRFFEKKNPKELYKALAYFDTNKDELSQMSNSNKHYFKKNFTRLQFKQRLLEII